MDTVIERCAGLDIGTRDLKACVRIPGKAGRRVREIRAFATATPGLWALQDWLAGHEVTTVGMGATSDYQKPVYYLLDDAFEVQLLNARHMRNVPGRKTDVAGSAWIAQLVEHGLVRPSVVPPPPIHRLRDLTRYRNAVVQERTREIQRREKVPEDAGIKLSTVALHTLMGRFTDHHSFLCQTMPERIDTAQATITSLTEWIEHEIAPLVRPSSSAGPPSPG